MANLSSVTINDTGNLTLPSGATRPSTITVTPTIVAFTTVASTTWTVPAGVTSVEVLVVAGGGGGGRYGGGGGAGGLIYKPDYPVTPGAVLSVTVGAGGNGWPGDAQNGGSAANGSNSRFDTLVAIGGGGGGLYNQGGTSLTGQSGGAGGSSGGSGTNGNNAQRQLEQTPAPAPVWGQGHAGGMQGQLYGAGGGGGGGAGTGGSNGYNYLTGYGGEGGAGLYFPQFAAYGSPAGWFAGGGGGTPGNNAAATKIAAGGIGGGGRGIPPSHATPTVADAVANTGGGGGGGADNTISGTARAGNGGSGIVLVRYHLTPVTTNPLGQTRINTTTNQIETYTSDWRTGAVGEKIVTNGLQLYLDAAKYAGSGTTWYDLSGRGNNATLVNSPGWSSSNGSYFSFSAGSSTYATLPTSTIPANSTEITLCFWNYGNSRISSSIFTSWDTGGNRHVNVHLTWSDGIVYWDCGTTTPDRISKQSSYADYYGWHHWTFTKNSVSGVMKIYRDGKLWQSGTGATFPMATPAYVTIGAYGQSSGYGTYHTGYIGQMQLYSRAITDEEVKQNYNAGKWRYQRPAPMVRAGNAAAPGSSPATAAANATEIKEMTGTTQNGFYWIKATGSGGPANTNGNSDGSGNSSGVPSGTGYPIRVWCDMNYKGGGWHLVMANCKSTLSPPGGTNGIGTLSYYQGINNVTYNGNYDGNLAFRVMVGLKYWPSLGYNIAQFTAASPVTLSATGSHTKRYLWSYSGWNSAYGFLGAAAVGDDGSGAGSPGMYSYHAANSYGFTTLDYDQDVSGSNCANSYGNTPFWYGSCWSGNMWGGGNSGSYQDGPFWDGSGTDYHNYMAVYLR